MDVHPSVRPLALTCAVVAGLGAVYAAVIALTGAEPAAGFVVQAVLHLGVALGLVALLRSGALAGRAGRTALLVAIAGFVLLAVAELVEPVSTAAGDALFDVAPLLAGIGAVVAGVALVRTRRWAPARRGVLLVAGGYVFAVLTPVLVVTGGPPARAAVASIAGWEVLWCLFGLSVLAQTRAAERSAGRDRQTLHDLGAQSGEGVAR